MMALDFGETRCDKVLVASKVKSSFWYAWHVQFWGLKIWVRGDEFEDSLDRWVDWLWNWLNSADVLREEIILFIIEFQFSLD